MKKKQDKAIISGELAYPSDATITAEDFIKTARQYSGTPYRHQGRSRAGTDCGGLLLMVGRDLKVTTLEVLGYSPNPDGATFERLLNKMLTKVRRKESVKPGDIIACDYGEGIQHTAIVIRKESPERILVIHAKMQHGVTEHYLHGRDRRGWKATYRLRNLA